jgi:hypothetical protein
VRFVNWQEMASRLRGKSIAIVGSAPSVLDNTPGFIDSHEVICRINNYKLSPAAGFRCDVHYSFYGTSIRKSAADLEADGVRLCVAKCPDSKPLVSDWHERNGHQVGIDFRYIYLARKNWWFCDTFIPDDVRFLNKFHLLAEHIPTTGFSAILDVLACEPRNIYLTGFDFMTSGLHNVNEPWRPGDPADPIGHRPELERAWLVENQRRFVLDERLRSIVASQEAMA